MNVRDVEQIKALISKAELESAKAQGVVDNIKADWREKYGTDDINEIRKIAEAKRAEVDKLKEKMAVLEDKIQNAYDWDSLEREMGA